jgi:hypothetical protein
MVMQGTPDVGQLAKQAADSCGILIDKIILGGIYGPVETASSGTILLPTSQNIAWDSNGFISATDTSYPDSVKKGLNTSKISQAVRMLREKFTNAPLVCVASNYAMSTLRADPKAANSLFNAGGPAQSMGVNNPYGGVDIFVSSELVEKTGLLTDASTTYREYAYVYALDQIRLGSSMPLSLDTMKNAERSGNITLIYSGMYDALRMQEEGVVRIEIAGPAGA